MRAEVKAEQEKVFPRLDKEAKTVLVAAGGTAGHIHPALAIARAIKRSRPDWQIVFCGNYDEMEGQLISKTEFEFYWIESTTVKRKKDISQWFNTFFTVMRGIREAKKLIDELNVVACIGAGGYVCVPLIMAAKNRGIKYFLHEQNAYPGKSSIFLSSGAETVFISYKASKSFFPKAKEVIFSGNPVKKIFYNLEKTEARKNLNIDKDEFIILVTGGSQGAKSLNEFTLDLSQLLAKDDNLRDYTIHLISGQKKYEDVMNDPRSKAKNLKVTDFTYDMPEEMAASDLVICRAGASTCAELQALGKASILVPYPYATNDHQTANAKALSDHEAAILIKDEDLNAKAAEKLIIDFMYNEDKITKMAKNAKSLAKEDAAEIIKTKIIKEVEENK